MKALLVEQIRDAYLDAEKSGKWVDYQAQRRLSSRIDGVLDAAYKSVKNGDFGPAIVTGFEILRRNIKLINHNDDSCGYLGGIMNEAMHLLHDVAEQDMNDDSRKFFMECCRKRLYDKTLPDGDCILTSMNYLLHWFILPQSVVNLSKKLRMTNG